VKRALVLWMGLWWLLAACQPSPGATPPEPTLPPPTPTPPVDRAAPATATPSPEATSPPAPATPTPAAPSQDLWGLPDPNTARWVRVAEGFRQPTAIVAAPGYPGRLFILERRGVAWTLWQGERQVFLDLRDRVGSEATEQGLLGMAFHPDFPETPWVFVNYTDKQGDTVVARFPVDVQSWTADPGQERVLLQVEQPYGNHNGGHLLFGPDGYLYIGLGDGGAAGDPQDNAQNPQTLLGKMLRIDVNVEPYGIPPDNAFPQGGGRPEIWAMGLRNPWRYDFDPLTGDLVISAAGGFGACAVNPTARGPTACSMRPPSTSPPLVGMPQASGRTWGVRCIWPTTRPGKSTAWNPRRSPLARGAEQKSGAAEATPL